MLDCVEVGPATAHRSSVIWLHGLGADGHDFEGAVPELGLPEHLGTRFVFPHAPVRPVTLNGGLPMRAWFDVYTLDHTQKEDAAGIRDAERQVGELVERELRAGIQPERLVLAGFSQGGALALHTALRQPRRLAGAIALSGWLPLADTVPVERTEDGRQTPVFLGHGRDDPLVPIALARRSHERLRALGHDVTWREYPVAHGVTLDELQEVGAWLRVVLGTG